MRRLIAFAMVSFLGLSGLAAQAQDQKPNILVIWGDDIGTTNISFNNRGLMGYLYRPFRLRGLENHRARGR